MSEQSTGAKLSEHESASCPSAVLHLQLCSSYYWIWTAIHSCAQWCSFGFWRWWSSSWVLSSEAVYVLAVHACWRLCPIIRNKLNNNWFRQVYNARVRYSLKATYGFAVVSSALSGETWEAIAPVLTFLTCQTCRSVFSGNHNGCFEKKNPEDWFMYDLMRNDTCEIKISFAEEMVPVFFLILELAEIQVFWWFLSFSHVGLMFSSSVKWPQDKRFSTTRWWQPLQQFYTRNPSQFCCSLGE